MVVDPLPATWTALCIFAIVLGATHGLDGDHLAAIDALVRYNGRERPRLARLTGVCFSLGHGGVVAVIAVIAALFARDWNAPQWLEITGGAISAAMLFMLAVVNLRGVVGSTDRGSTPISGLRFRVLRRFVTARSALSIAAVGALFAVSFDTVSLAALFAVAASRFGGLETTIIVAVLFVLAMASVDGVNALWINRLIARADATTSVAARVFALAVVATSASVGIFIVARLMSPTVDGWGSQHQWAAGALVTAALVIAFVTGIVAARSASRPHPNWRRIRIGRKFGYPSPTGAE